MNMLNKNSVKELKQNKRINNFADGIAAAFFDSMRYDPTVLAFGLGATDPKNAEDNTIRKLFGISIDKNSVHGSDSVENAKIELDFFFKD